MKKTWYILASLLVLVVALLFVLRESVHEALPEGESGAAADSLATRVLDATGYDAWEQTAAVRWSFKGTRNYLWDVKSQFAEISWDDTRVLMDLNTQKGLAYEKGKEIDNPESLLEKAWSYWCNDSFWFMAHHKLFDAGTVRKLVMLEDGNRALLVTYESGGVTPGDSYLWILDDDAVPTGFKMWVSIIPVGGVYFSWEDWTELATGIRVATNHKNDMSEVKILGAEAARDLFTLTDSMDVFAPLRP